MAGEPKQVKQIVLDDSLWTFLENMGRDSEYSDKRGVHSKLIREMVSAAAMKWRESPYVCRSAKHMVLVTADGHVLYRQVHELKLNAERGYLPCVVEMKPEKRRDYRRRIPEGVGEADFFRSLWLFNYFSARRKEGDLLLSEWVDREGIDSKMADLVVNQSRGRHLTREMVVGVRDYVQWQNGKPGYDRIDLPIDIPTRNLEFCVVVDMDLYRQGLAKDEIPDLEIEFRNREGARFENRKIGEESESRLKAFAGRLTDTVRSPKADQVTKCLKAFSERIRSLADAEIDLGEGRKPLLTDENREVVHRLVESPKSFLFMTLDWPAPYWGLEVCIRWEKPKPRPSST
jgi:hypothetical protein